MLPATVYVSIYNTNLQLIELLHLQEYEVDSECSDEGRDGTRSSLSLESHSLLGDGRARHVYFSNQEYYQRLEELKRTHLRNMAELERMYISQGKSSRGEEEDRGLGRVKNGEAREPVRFDMPVLLINEQEYDKAQVSSAFRDIP